MSKTPLKWFLYLQFCLFSAHSTTSSTQSIQYSEDFLTCQKYKGIFFFTTLELFSKFQYT